MGIQPSTDHGQIVSHTTILNYFPLPCFLDQFLWSSFKAQLQWVLLRERGIKASFPKRLRNCQNKVVVHVLIKSFSFLNENSPFKQSCSLTVSWQHQCLAIERGKLIKSGVSYSQLLKCTTFSLKCKANNNKVLCIRKNKDSGGWEETELLCCKSRQLVPSSSGSQHTSQGLCDIWLTCFGFSSLFLSHQERAVHAAPSCHANYSKGIMTLTPFQCSLGLQPIRQMGKNMGKT